MEQYQADYIPTSSGIKSNLPIILIDTREQNPFTFRASPTLAGVENIKLDYGDYQIKGMPDLIAIERKKDVVELCGNIGKYRQRFENELERMQVCKFKFIVIEDYYSSIYAKNRFTRMHPNSIFGSIISLELKYNVHFIFAGNRDMAQRISRALLIKAHEYRLQGLV